MSMVPSGAAGAHGSPNIVELFARNRAWAAETERTRPGFFTALVDQQTPRYMWIGCSDSFSFLQYMEYI